MIAAGGQVRCGRRVLLSVVLALAAPQFTAIGQPAAALAVEVDCTPAVSLTEAGYPQRAIAYVDGVNAGYSNDAKKVCRDERAAAVERVQSAESQALEAERLVAEAANFRDYKANLTRTAAKSAAQNAHVLDRENARAIAFLNPDEPTTDTRWQKAAEAWESFTKTTLGPLGTVALPAALLFVGLLAVARILAAAWTWKGRTRAGQANRRLRWGCLGLAVASAGAVGLRSAAWASLTGTTRWLLASALIGVMLAGVWAVASGMARRLRIVIAVRTSGSDDSAKSAEVLALLEQFGASPPKGIERPVGPDVNALENVLSEVGTGWVATITSGLRTLVGWTPWHVVIDDSDQPETIVAVTRNGHSEGSIVITPAMCTVAETKIDPAVYAAAFVITTLARAHRGFEGLCGATGWQGLALQYTAAQVGHDVARPLLAEALRRDPGSWLTQLDYAHATWRTSSSASDLREYATFLDQSIMRLKEQFSGSPDAVTPLLVRAHLARAAVRINLVFIGDESERDDATQRTARDAKARQAIGDLCHAVARADALLITPGEKRWLRGIKTRTAAMASTIPERDLADLLRRSHPGPASEAMVRSWDDEILAPPAAHYSRACALATPNLRVPAQHTTVETDKIVRSLHTASASPVIRDWMRKDPQLAAFFQRGDYASLAPSRGETCSR